MLQRCGSFYLRSSLYVLQLCAYAFGNLIEFLGGEGEVRICKAHVCLALHGYEVNVCMGNFKSQCALAHLDARNCLADGDGHLFGKDLQTGYLLVAEVEDVVNLVLWNYQCVAFLQWVDIKEGEVVLVLGNLVARYLACNYA